MSTTQTPPNPTTIRDSVDAAGQDSSRSNTPASIPQEVIVDAGINNQPQASDNNSSSRPTSRIDSLTWDDIQTDPQGEPYGFLGVPFVALTCKQLRIVCSRLEIRGVKNVRKEVMIDRIKDQFKNRAAYAALESAVAAGTGAGQRDVGTSAAPAPRREIQCPFRLLNILFSDLFAERFADTGNVANRQLLDSGLGANDQHFWESVQQAFVSPTANTVYDQLQFQDDPIIAQQGDDIDPSKVVHHDWKKLRSIWKLTNSDYKAAVTRFTVSGTHENEFWNFCAGKVEVLYLRKHLEKRPNLADFVQADLPLESSLSSSMGTRQIISRLTSPGSDIIESNADSNQTEARTKKRKASNPIASAISKSADAESGKRELFLSRISIMQKEDARRERAEARRVDEKKMNEWDLLSKNIRQLRQDLRDPALTDEDKADILSDLGRLRKRRDVLADELGWEKDASQT